MKRSQTPPEYPPVLRFLLWIGKPFGLAFVPQNHLQVVNHMGQYVGVKGPGVIAYNRLTETLGPLVPTNGQFLNYTFEGIISRDVLPVTIEIKTIIRYDPRRSSVELASILTRLPQRTLAGIAEAFMRWVLLATANAYNAGELTQRDVMASIEKEVKTRVAAEVDFLGLLVELVQIMRVTLPPTLAERHALIAQRRAGVLAGTEFHPVEFRRALITEVLENIGRSEKTEALLNFNEMLESYVAGQLPGTQPRRIVDHPPQATLRSDEDVGGKPAAKEGPSDSDDEAKPPRRRSRL